METNTSHSKREIIDAFLRLKRAEEEICMLTVEMKHTINYYEHEVECVQKCIQDYSLQESDAFSRGAVTLLHGLLVKLQVHLHESLNLYSSIDKSTASTLSVPSYSDSDLKNLLIPIMRLVRPLLHHYCLHKYSSSLYRSESCHGFIL